MKLIITRGLRSVSLEKSYGLRFELPRLGGMGVHYGYPYCEAAIVVYLGGCSYGIGIARMDQPKRKARK